MRRHTVLATLLLQAFTLTVRAQWLPLFGGAAATGGFGLENYAQCGGMGAACSPTSGGCIDGQWPGATCKSGKCIRNTAYHWMCKPDKLPFDDKGHIKNPDGAADTPDTSSGRQASKLAPRAGSSYVSRNSKTETKKSSKEEDLIDESTIKLWAQCGGDEGTCKDYGDGQCRDCAFEGYKCQGDAVCAKVMDGFWQCGPNNRMKEGPKCEPLPPPPAAPGAIGGKCQPPQLGQEVDGMYLETMYLQDPNRRMYYMECCGYCSGTQGCVAFQVNVFNQNASTCDLFTTYTGVMPGSAMTAAGVMTAIAKSETVSIAG